MKTVFLILGSLFTGIGFLGIFLPVLPTTPFLLLAAGCYARSSERFYSWLLNHRLLGSYVRAFREHRKIPLRGKIASVSMLWFMILISVLFFVPLITIKILLILIAAGVTVYILSFPTLNEQEEQDPPENTTYTGGNRP